MTKTLLFSIFILFLSTSLSAQESLIKNGDFETKGPGGDWDATGWSVNSNGEVYLALKNTENNVLPHNGNLMMRAMFPDPDGLSKASFSQDVKVVEGTDYGLGFWAAIANGSEAVVTVSIASIINDTIAATIVDKKEYTVDNSGWQWFSLNFNFSGANVQQDDDSCRVIFSFKEGGKAWMRVFFDDVNFVEGQATQEMHTTSAKDMGELDVKIYPNPASDVVTIQSDSYQASLFIHDLAGRVVMNKMIKRIETINISELPRGIYLVSIEGDSGSFRQKLIKR